MALAVVLGAALASGYTAAVQLSAGETLHAAGLGTSALVFGLARFVMPGRVPGSWIRILAVALLGLSSAALTLLTGGAALGPLIVMTFVPVLATFLVSPRVGGVVAAASCLALVLAAQVVPQVRSPGLVLGETNALVAVALLILSFWAVTAYYERGRRADLDRYEVLRDELQRTAARFRAYTENARDIVVETAEDGTILYASPGHEAMLGRPPSELLGITKTRNLHFEDLPRVEAYFAELLRGGGHGAVSARYVRPDGTLCWLQLRGRYYRNADGEGRVVLFARDETPEREATEEREALIGRLQDALDSIETLRGIVPICAECKNVRREDGAWQEVEAYVAAHSLADFSHGLCDKCLAGHGL